ncbi:MAG: hypothetical protein WCO00_01380 [Rhodospirillaceae bacterium]
MMGRWCRVLMIGLGLAVLPVMAALPRADPLRLERTRPDHQGPRTVEPIDPPPPADHVYRKVDLLAYRLPGAVTKWATLDAKLSRLCRLGAFRQQRPDALYALAPEGSYGVAFGEGANLHDPQNLAKPGMVYFFTIRETSNCLVLKVSQSRLSAYSTSRFGAPQAAPPAR